MTAPATLPLDLEDRPGDAPATASNAAERALEVASQGLGPDQQALAGGAETGGVIRCRGVSARNDPSPSSSTASTEPAPKGARPSATRSLSAKRQRAREEILRGRAQAMRHGIYARVANLPDVAVEVELQLALRPGLDPLRDRRLVETWAMASVQLLRAHEAIERDGLTEHLGSFVGRQGPLVERLERSMHEREQARAAAARKGGVDLSVYRSGGGAS